MPHQPYSADLAQSDFFLFFLRRNNDEIKWAVEEFLEDHTTTFFRGGVAMLKRRLSKYIDVEGTILKYSEKLSCCSNYFRLRLRTFWTTVVYEPEINCARALGNCLPWECFSRKVCLNYIFYFQYCLDWNKAETCYNHVYQTRSRTNAVLWGTENVN